MICFPNAKINLGLNVLSRRTDGYHNIETIFYPIPLSDVLEITEAAAFSFSQTGIIINNADTESNLAIKAMRLLSTFNLPPLDVHLLKAIPFGAGLGGGSSDAAFMLKLLNNFGQLHLSVEHLEKLAAKLGADCPFFIRNVPACGTGTGNILTPIQLSLKGYYLVLVKPPVSVPTAQAYAGINPKQPAISPQDAIRLPITEWRHHLTNDFEETIFALHPEIADVKERLYKSGALYAAMSGSGSAVFALFDRPVRLEEQFAGYFYWHGLLTL
ncbi:MAG: 4-(cytidine 5'-diphospho)-2-C-methyl-D-erythritol kinase [Tannerellaceae bacterium]|nr:4-(cytidine 5'-diphospho)-2-C-methyl-D-erythritol kinase [Tannerellaceae bacterium]